MARPNRVFFVSSVNKHLRQTFVTYTDFLDLLIKALVSGFGPYPIVSISVTDKIATVTLDSEATIHPGMKVDITGTGVTDLDGLQEVEAIDGNTFTFKVDVLDCSFSNDLTFGYPSFGWTLLYRTADRAVLQTGSGSSKNNCILFEFNRSNSSGAFLNIFKVKNPRSVLDFENKAPLPLYRNIAIPIDARNLSPALYDFFFYGDDSFVLLGYKYRPYNGAIYFNYTERSLYNTMMFGELKKSPFISGSFILAGSTHTSIDSNIHSMPFLLGNSEYNTNRDSAFVWVNSAFNTDIEDSITPAIVNGTGLINGITGKQSIGTKLKANLNNNYMDVLVRDINYNIQGFLPGINFLTQRPVIDFDKPQLKVLFPVNLVGDLQNRKNYMMYGGYGNETNDSSLTINNASAFLLDLTGPIR